MGMELTNKRVLVTTVGWPHPSRGASVVLFFHYIKALTDKGAEIFHIVMIPDGKEDQEARKQYLDALDSTQAVHIETLKIPAQLLLPNGFKVEVNLPETDRIKNKVADFNPQAGLAFDLAAGMMLNQYDVPNKAIWLGDLLFKSNWYNYLYSFKEDLKTLRWLPYALIQTRQWKKIYKQVLSSFDDTIVSSKSSEGALKQLGLSSRFHPYPWPETPRVARNETIEKPRFLFFGTLIGLGSRSSMHFLLDKVYPRLIDHWGQNGFEIIIGGRDKPRGWMLDKINQCPEIQFVGFIDDLGECVQTCHGVIAPLDVPVGNRSRILTAWSMGALVVTHENAALGNPSLIDGETAYLAKSPEEFAHKMILAVENTEKSKLIVDQAQVKYLKEYSLESASHLFVDLISKRLCHETRTVVGGITSDKTS